MRYNGFNEVVVEQTQQNGCLRGRNRLPNPISPFLFKCVKHVWDLPKSHSRQSHFRPRKLSASANGAW